MQKTNLLTKPSPHFQPVRFTVTQPSSGSFRALMIWLRANGSVTLPRQSTRLGDTPRSFVALIRDGNAANRDAIDAVLGKAQSASSLGGDLSSLEERIHNFYTTLGIRPHSTDLRGLVAALGEFHAGRQDAAAVLARLVEALPAPPGLVQPASLDDAWRVAEGVTAVMYLRRAVTRAIATHEGITADLGSAAERKYERQGVVFLGQLELACAMADEGLRAAAEEDGDDPDVVSAALIKAFAERSRGMGHPLVVRETYLGAGVVQNAVVETSEMPGRLTQLVTHVGRGVHEVGAAVGVAVWGLGRLLWEGLARLTRSVWYVLRAHKSARVALLLGVVALLLSAATGVLPAEIERAAVRAADSGLVAPAPTPMGAAQLRLALRTTGGYSFAEMADYFGLRDANAVSYLMRYNAPIIRDLQGKVPPRQLFTAALPAGLTLYVPTVTVTLTGSDSVEALAQKYGTTVEAIERLNPGMRARPIGREATAPTLVIPVGREGLLPASTVETEVRDFNPRATTFPIGNVAK